MSNVPSIDDIRIEAKSDLTFDITNVEHYAVKLGLKKEKYSRYLQSYRLLLKKEMLEVDRVYNARYRYFDTQTQKKHDRRDIPHMIRGDQEYQKAVVALTYAEENVRYLDSVIKAFDNMSFTINSAVKMHIFKNGG